VEIYDVPWVGRESSNNVGRDRTLHGSVTPTNLPEGYRLAVVPGDADFEDFNGTVSSDYSVLKMCVALGQAIFGTATLYQARGDQITQYGFAAFGLTVAPYVIMSLVNLIGNAITPDYAAMYLVHSPIMDEALQRIRNDHAAEDRAEGQACTFDGVIGSLGRKDESVLKLARADQGWTINSISFTEPSDGVLQVTITPSANRHIGGVPQAVACSNSTQMTELSAPQEHSYPVQLEVPSDTHNTLLHEDRRHTRVVLIPSSPPFRSTRTEKVLYSIESIQPTRKDGPWSIQASGPVDYGLHYPL